MNKNKMLEKEEEFNIIIANILIKKDNQKEKIISSYENMKEEEKDIEWNKIEAIENEKEIKQCDIYINNQKINFNYYYIFPNKGRYIIKYIFKNNLKSTNFMFSNCKTLLSLYFQKFNSQNVINMQYMFYRCHNLKEIIFNDFNTQNVIKCKICLIVAVN